MQMNLSIKLWAPRSRWFGRTIVCGVLLILPSCGIPRLRCPESAPDIPGNFKAPTNADDLPENPDPGENSAQLGIEQFYNDSVLSILLDQALANNRELKILNEEVQVARK